MSDKLKWGIIGTGGIAATFARALAVSQSGQLLAVGSRTPQAATEFGARFGAPRCHGSYEELLADPEVQAVYISTPHPFHAEWAIKAARAGKHILCEKPLTMNHAEAMTVIEAAHRHDVFLMEAFMYRCHPQTAKLVELLRDKAIGDVRLIQASFGFHSAFDLESRLLKNELGGGGILDVGCYCVSMARLIAGAATGRDFAEPFEVQGMGHIGAQSGVDEYATALMRFRGAPEPPGERHDILAQLVTGVQLNQENVVRIFGTRGHIFVPSPWFCGPTDGVVKIMVRRDGGPLAGTEEVVTEEVNLYAAEADVVAENIQRRQAVAPAMSWNDSLGNMHALDRWRAAIGLTYEAEKPAAMRLLAGAGKAPQTNHTIKQSRIAGIDKPVSRLVMGSVLDGASLRTPHGFAMFDDFMERGGNCFDTAVVYGSEPIVGQWIKNRGVREEIVLLGKGAHTPYCDPESLTRQLHESLGKLQTDYVDIYMMHRDNPQVPVGEFIDVLNEHQQAGRMRVFGGSNWSTERVDQANEYARRKGLQGFSAVSNNFSMARMVDEVWAGCISASDAASREWFTRTQMPLLAWSSQARGFFVRAAPDFQEDAELVRCWYSEDNFRRLERVRQLAEERGYLPINIALAYVLCQPFPTFPLIGPSTLEETRTSLPALDIELSPQELRWLNLEEKTRGN